MTCDGACVNRRLVKLHYPTDELVYKVANPNGKHQLATSH